MQDVYNKILKLHVVFNVYVVVSFSLGDWDLRSGIIQGKRDRVIRYLDKAFEDVAVQIREKQAHGENVTQAIFLINLANFNLAQQGNVFFM